MREGAKRRLAGAIAIVALVVIFVPMLFEEKTPVPSAQDQDLAVPPEPTASRSGSASESFLGPADSGVGGVAMDQDTQVDDLSLPPQGAPVAQTGGTPAGTLPAETTRAVVSPAPVSELPATSSASSSTGLSHSATPSAPTRPAVQPGMLSWVVQVASLTTPQSASALESRLRAAGYSAFVEQAQISGKTYYRVRVGPESDRTRIEQVAGMLQQQQHLDTLIQQYP